MGLGWVGRAQAKGLLGEATQTGLGDSKVGIEVRLEVGAGTG